ncbi:LuxR C-terminal-related transcriptional regulator [Streptomyces sp. TX20-6-3]|uniref:helix-turn-helix transcriptional regulator n=1 Tax=Streptomyces sp. TX20-6-3 TaxID=3028705 RepID=UPI0029ABD508|nr:LuxR C-terminal-related transcriptional regulator [Streptomyces sp. TX20-6-3]MDX2565343.1 LuxR C-terminal-related transcriptional regulator [Streptomyces sp. TX20-6-3]
MAGLVDIGGRWPLVGRDELLSEFQRLLGGSRNSGLMIQGAAGVGKSRLAVECAEAAEASGWHVGRAVATEAASGVPLGAIAHLLPVGVDFSDPQQGFEAVATRLRSAEGRSLLLLVDDVPLLDGASAQLLRELLEANVIFLVGTARQGQIHSDAVRRLVSSEGIYHTDLKELTKDQVAELLQRVLGGPVGRQTAHEFYERTVGNPLFIRELVLGALASGDLESDGEVWGLTRGSVVSGAVVGTQHLAELISARLVAADPRGRLLLETLAVCGELSLTGALTVAPAEVLEGLEEAGLVRRQPDQRRQSVVIVHPLYSDILRTRVPYLRRREILLAQAQFIEAYGARRKGDVLRTVSWRLAAGANANSELLIEAAAHARHAHDYTQVVHVLEALPASDHTSSTRLMLGEALSEVGRSEEAETILLEAADSATEENEALAVAAARSMNHFLVGAETNKALGVLNETQYRSEGLKADRAISVTRGSILALSGRLTEALPLLAELEESVDDAADASIWLLGSSVIGGAMAMSGDPETGKKIARQGFEANEQIGLGFNHPEMPLVSLIISLSETGEIDEARRVGEQAFNDFAAAQAPLPRVWIAYHMGRVEWLSGNAAASRRWYAESIALARNHGHRMALQPAFAGLAAAAALLGDTPAAEKALRQSWGHPHMGIFAGEERLAEAWIKATSGALTSASELLMEAAEAAAATGYITSQAMILTDAARLGGARLAAPALAKLASQGEGDLVVARAKLAAAFAADDPELLMDVAEKLSASGVHLLAAEAATAAATAWRRKGRPRKAASAAQAAARSIAHCPGVRTPLLRTAEIETPLTNREREIALLAATGRSSKQIADQLMLSARTVDNHLQRIFSKLGVTSRRGLGPALGVPSDAAD